MILHRWRATAWLLGGLLLASCSDGPQPGAVLDEAKQAGRDGASFQHAADDYFHDMDGGVALDAGGDHRAATCGWSGAAATTASGTRMTDYTFGAFDLLKIISSHPSLGYTRDNRWTYLGLVNEPCFEQRDRPRPEPPRPVARCARARTARPIRSKTKASIPASRSARAASRWATARRSRSARTTATPRGIVGLRLFPNPDFDEKAAKAWDPERYYTDPSYYNRKDLVRPYRVGMSCGFCHVGPSPVNPPADPENPTYANLSSSVGAQYMWVDRLFIFNSNKPEGRKNFMYQLVHTYRPGAHGHLAGLDRQHQQPAHDERGLQLRRAPGHGQAHRQREARRRRAQQQAVQRLRHAAAR